MKKDKKLNKEDIEEIDNVLQDYIRYTYIYMSNLKERKRKAEEVRELIHNFKVLEKEELIEDIAQEYAALIKLICALNEEEQ